MNVDVQAMARRLQESLGTVIVGKEAEIELCIVGLLCRGHLLIEDVPGTGKTLLAKALARSSGCSFERVQFTPDLLPGDVTGVSVYNPQDADVRVPQRTDLRPGAARRRDQSRDPENAIGTARGDGGVAGDRRRHQPSTARSLHGARNPEPDRAGRNVPASGGAGRSLPAQASARIPPGGRGGRDAGPLPVGQPARRARSRSPMRQRSRRPRPCAATSTATPPSRITASASSAGPANTATSRSDRHHAARSACFTRDRRAPRLPARDFVLPDDIKDIAANVLEHRVMLRPNAELRGLTAAAVLEEVLATKSVPMTGRRLA